MDDHIEPGLLGVFRLFVGVRIGLLLLTVCVWLVDPGVRMRRLPLLALAETSTLMIYLSWPWLRRTFKRAYLPIAVMIATVGPILAYGLTVMLRIANGLPPDRLADDTWTILFVLLIPLLVVSWQYRFRAVVAFTLGSALFETVVAAILGSIVGAWPQEWVGLVIVRTVTYLAVGYVIARLMNAQRQQRLELAEANRQIARYATTLEQLAISQERNRLARDMHDTLAHSLSAVAVQLEAVRSVWEADPDAARSLLDRSLITTRRGLQEARRAIHDLRASPLDDLGLELAIRARAEAVAQRLGAELRLHTSDPPEELSAEVEQGVYRIADEALSNVGRHARGADCLQVHLSHEEGMLRLQIRDDGPGFDPRETLPSGHFGLKGLHERAIMIGGKLAIESARGKGTTVTLEVPL